MCPLLHVLRETLEMAFSFNGIRYNNLYHSMVMYVMSQSMQVSSRSMYLRGGILHIINII